MNPSRNHEVAGSISGLTQWVKDLTWLWLWCGPVATALIRPLAWEPPYAAIVALKRQNNNDNNNNNNVLASISWFVKWKGKFSIGQWDNAFYSFQ